MGTEHRQTCACRNEAEGFQCLQCGPASTVQQKAVRLMYSASGCSQMKVLAHAAQHPDIVAGAVPFVWMNGPALYCFVLGECLKRYLMAQVSTPLCDSGQIVADV